tara:strand:- start:250 stop:519 length:270 start_codon:yes stop_codon:yes gene_type:complete
MLEYEGKPLDTLSLEETIEFEKIILKRLMGSAMMSQQVQDQLSMYVEEVKIHKADMVAHMRFDNSTTKDKVENTLNIGDIDGEFDEDEQ